LLSFLVVWHLVVSVGSVFADVPVGQAIRTVTGPWEKLLGVNQGWPMFGVPPRATRTLQFVGITADGRELPLPMFSGEPDPESIVWRYDRLGKLERNSLAANKKELLQGLIRAACRSSEVVTVRIDELTRPSPLPFSGDPGPRASWPTTVETLRTQDCQERR
jgi:hypothetical protein